jgi:hypothetical protein
MNKRAPEILEEAAKTYRERNALYGDNYLKFGRIMKEMFSDTEITVDGFNRLGVFVQCLSKLTRYAENMDKGGHFDSALDLSVYAAMLAELTKEEK